jgi:DNA-binding GntR family transcriptional regulator
MSQEEGCTVPVPHREVGPSLPRILVRERVLEQLREAILTGVLLPGERLEEAALRTWLGVSATPIRQALHALAIEGLVVSAPQSHTIVAIPQSEHAVPNLQAVGVLLAGVSALTVPGLAADELQELAKIAGVVADRLAAGDARESSEVSRAYFMRLIERCPNSVLVGLTKRSGTSLGYHAFMSRDALGDALHTVENGYRSLQSALLRGDASAIDRATRACFLLATDDRDGEG